jgi:hypothetical protein
LTIWVFVAITATFTLMFSLNTHTFAFHENLEIDDNKASQLYQTNPNDPAIVQWKNALQSAIDELDSMNECFVNPKAGGCESTILNMIAQCKSHPNTLLACNDSRLSEYPLILKNAPQIPVSKVEGYAASIFEKCFRNPNSNTTFEVASPSCDTELQSLRGDCQMASSPYDYCKDERFVGYLTQHNILNSTVSP